MTKQHEEKHVTSSELVTDVVIGMSDGLIIPFALAAALSRVVENTGIIVMAGSAAVVAGAIAMGLGGYLAGRADLGHSYTELQREQQEKENIPEVFTSMGLSEPTQHLIAEEMSKDKKNWLDLMIKHDWGLEKINPKRSRNRAINIAASYLVGGLVPLTPYFFTRQPFDGLLWSAIITVTCLFLFGFFKAKITERNPWTGAIRVALIGSITALAAYLIAGLFS